MKKNHRNGSQRVGPRSFVASVGAAGLRVPSALLSVLSLSVCASGCSDYQTKAERRSGFYVSVADLSPDVWMGQPRAELRVVGAERVRVFALAPPCSSGGNLKIWLGHDSREFRYLGKFILENKWTEIVSVEVDGPTSFFLEAGMPGCRAEGDERVLFAGVEVQMS